MPKLVLFLLHPPPQIAVSAFIGQVKGATAHRINEEIKPEFRVKWQEGYGVLSLRKDELEKVSRYIDNQEAHHDANQLSDLLERTDGEDESFPQTPPPEGG
jgi:putative transposase